jgi:CheY-like chemotaxis protein
MGTSVRALQAKLAAWVGGYGREPEAHEPDEPLEAFEPANDLRRVLQPAPGPVAHGPHDHTRILVAEDEAFHRRVLRVLLASPRVSLIEVEDGQSAIDLLALRSFDLLLLDLTLPQMNGEDVIRWIRRSRANWADIPILGMVGAEDRRDVNRLLSLGMTDWTPKPLSRHELAGAVVRLMPGLYDAGL